MANKKQIYVVKQGARVWNDWRKHNVGLSSNLNNAELPGAMLRMANLAGVRLEKANLIEADLSAANLSRASLIGADLSRANLIGADLSNAILIQTNLNGANLDHANFTGTQLFNADLREAYMLAANLNYSNLINANLSKANLSFADLFHTNFSGANLERANLASARTQFTSFVDVDLSTTKGLDKVIHLGPSILGIDTIYKSRGEIPEYFLRGARVPDNFIAYMSSLTGKAFEFYSCFISYSSKAKGNGENEEKEDEEFAHRLYADLQSEGVRCWFAPEDLKIGDKFRQRIEETIQLQDKLLVILSERSISSTWVEEEVEAAIERERLENRLILFPIRIDNSIIHTKESWAAMLRRTRHIGDFTGWQSFYLYKKALDRLLRDLKRNTPERIRV